MADGRDDATSSPHVLGHRLQALSGRIVVDAGEASGRKEHSVLASVQIARLTHTFVEQLTERVIRGFEHNRVFGVQELLVERVRIDYEGPRFAREIDFKTGFRRA